MIGRLAMRSLSAHPVRSAVLAAGFGAGVAVMAILLGVAEVILRQAQSPALVGGGDVLVHMGEQVPARLGRFGHEAARVRELRGRVARGRQRGELLHGAHPAGGVPVTARERGQ